ncbi:uncharacterized protein MELLADRAFT_62225 [Melampsora larici-populina 98AG31]|uniref:Secreted protein n=1 Tax=Melampsora larici-populina (strain 98AG31 / pathotype 3-4-7) TaxID=747676 RepID=F4RI28_MELLP|nr:uncharacterized protein MELLADRAFT_62225 [Melampsora larici-populina 98AG31]EGG07926.1 hypothetical protein MELLADRAFT_62225 [Melampsora larici-populina 98AG31]
MLLPTTFILLVLATARIAVCAPVEDTVKSTTLLIGSDNGLENPVQKEKAASSAAGNVVSTRGGGCKGCACSHARSKPKEIYTKIEGSPVDSGSSQDAISVNAGMKKQGDFLVLSFVLSPTLNLICFVLIETKMITQGLPLIDMNGFFTKKFRTIVVVPGQDIQSTLEPVKPPPSPTTHKSTTSLLSPEELTASFKELHKV